MEYGTLLEWYVAPGDTVERGSVVALVSTDKADVDIEIWQSGTVIEQLVELGIEIPVGTPILRLGLVIVGTTPTPETKAKTGAPTVVTDTRPVVEGPPSGVSAPSSRSITLPSQGEIVAASPLARAEAAKAGIHLRTVTGSGPEGAVLARDVEAYRLAPPLTDVEEVRVGVVAPPAADRAATMRQAIAARMASANREIPHYYLEHDVDLGPALAWLEERNASRSIADRVLPAALLLSAAAAATAAMPDLNGFWVEDHFQPAPTIDLAVVVALRGGGLVTPKITAADQLTLDEMMAALTTIVTAARRGALRSSWLEGAGLTITNLGDRGVDRVSGVIFPPQVALVGFGGVRQRPWVVDGAVVARPVLTVSLAADHRASDGIVGSRFLSIIADHLQRPEES
ncbi:MAG: 2-oxo acid dehydrogenase subunit E2 [Actinomycetia bacterium]|nr:2-oxo acid dehydrogenase subunit E2 [Actinomycetes bacterium]MCP4223151.1 2-oxo acid dehydrogenase subunit E2 [Actinomycetes bacterium]MCP5031620.1 2-oxo acid dehydrogenase subunit E2 [Actinomycetes bacterium]